MGETGQQGRTAIAALAAPANASVGGPPPSTAARRCASRCSVLPGSNMWVALLALALCVFLAPGAHGARDTNGLSTPEERAVFYSGSSGVHTLSPTDLEQMKKTSKAFWLVQVGRTNLIQTD